MRMPNDRRRRVRAAALLAGLSLLTSCVVGPRALDYAPAQTAHGVQGQFIVLGQRIKGELLEVSDTAFVIETSDAVVMIPKFVVDEAIFQGFDSVRAKDLVGDVLEQYRLLSRYPAGMPAATLHTLLAETGQQELKIVRP